MMASPPSHLAPLKEVENDTLEVNFECFAAVTDACEQTSTDTMSTESTSSEAVASHDNRDTEEKLETFPTKRHQPGVWRRRFTTALATPLEGRASQVLTAAILLPRRASLVPYARHTRDLPQSAMNARARWYSYGGAMTYPTGHEPVEPKQSREQFDNASRVSPTWVAGWNVLNIIQGVGTLGVPYACAHAGWIFIPVILLIALICCFTGRLLGECLYEYPPEHCKNYFHSHKQIKDRKRVSSTFACIASVVLPHGGRITAALVVLLEFFGAGVIYTILLGQSAHALLGDILLPNKPISYWTLIMVYLCLPLLLVSNIRFIAWFSVTGLVGLFCTMTLVIVYCCLEIPHDTTKILSRFQVTDVGQLPVSLSIILLSFCAHSALPGIEGSMAKPEQYGHMLDVVFAVGAALKLLFGLLPTLVFGTSVAQAVTDSMVEWPKLVIATHSCVLVNVYFSLPLLIFLMGEQLDFMVSAYVSDNLFLKDRCSLARITWYLSTRLAMIHFVLLCSVLIPQFALIMGLIGAITGSLLCFIFPTCFHLYLFWPHLNLFSRTLRILVAIFGLFVLIFGAYMSVMGIAKVFTHK